MITLISWFDPAHLILIDNTIYCRQYQSSTHQIQHNMKHKKAALLPVPQFWSLPVDELYSILHSTSLGLTDKEATNTLLNIAPRKKGDRWKDVILLLRQYKNPLVLLLVFAVALSLFLGEYSDSAIILLVLFFTGLFGFIQERNAGRAVEKLKQLVHSKTRVRRNGTEKEIDIDSVVPGDIVLLNAGNIIPADCIILESVDLHVNESSLTGESFPSEKFAGTCDKEIALAKVSNSIFRGTNVINGTATALAVNTGDNTEFGKITASLESDANETSFEKGIRKFGYLLLQITVGVTLLILVLNVIFHKPFIESLLFSLALAVGLTPELLPAIVTVTLSAGAKRLASKKVIVKRLNAIQNLGQMNVFCSDKTGTLTEGVIDITAAVSYDGSASLKTLLYAQLNAQFETGFSNIIDEAIRKSSTQDLSGYAKVDEVPYDFIRKRLSVVVQKDERHIMITKGAVKNILDVCIQVEQQDGIVSDIKQLKATIENEFEKLSNAGYRTVAVAYKDVTGDPVINKDDECNMCFLGFLLLSDPPKQGILTTINELKSLGIELKIISGDNPLVVKHLAESIGLEGEVITGTQMHKMSSEAFERKVSATHIFAEIEPSQKERIIKALQKAGTTVGYLGDGINDVSALHAADIGISINNAVDVAREAADLVLLERNMEVIIDGVKEGRVTFMNTMKYIFITTSANFGNMFSMATASLWLPFLPLLPTQILLNNFLSDLPAVTLASDKVDHEQTLTPKKWNIKSINRFMFIFGLQSSLFDLATFGVLLYLFKSTPTQFRTAWFIESLLTEILIIMVIRTQRSLFRSKPSKYLLIASLATVAICILLPYMPFASAFQLAPLPVNLFIIILVIAVLYTLSAELSKKYLIKNF
jgi:P-type Mg2+ transporter